MRDQQHYRHLAEEEMGIEDVTDIEDVLGEFESLRHDSAEIVDPKKHRVRNARKMIDDYLEKKRRQESDLDPFDDPFFDNEL